jgi:hypothetical protein
MATYNRLTINLELPLERACPITLSIGQARPISGLISALAPLDTRCTDIPDRVAQWALEWRTYPAVGPV